MSQTTEEKLMKEDLYKLFNVEPDADEKTIRSAYRKAALKYHPDRNPDNKLAVEHFLKFGEALKILVDKDTRIRYDVKRKAKQRQQERTDLLDKTRRGAKKDLEEREELLRAQHEINKQNQNKEKWLREEGARILAEEMRLMKEEIQREKRETEKKKYVSRTKESQIFRLKFKYNPNTLNEDQVSEVLRIALDDPVIAFSKKKKSSGIIETINFEKARQIVNVPLDKDNLKISWYEIPIPPTYNLDPTLTMQQKEFFQKEADILTALRRRTKE